MIKGCLLPPDIVLNYVISRRLYPRDITPTVSTTCIFVQDRWVYKYVTTTNKHFTEDGSTAFPVFNSFTRLLTV
jgi:hypothetical protein